MTINEAFRKVEDIVSDNLLGDWTNLSIRINRFRYNISLVYNVDDYGYTILNAIISIPDYETAIKMSEKDYIFLEELNDRLKNVDFENYY